MPAKKRCFVISPIGAPGSDVRAHADDVFNYIIEPVTTQMGYETERGDHAARPVVFPTRCTTAFCATIFSSPC